jgi:hypothetical protein
MPRSSCIANALKRNNNYTDQEYSLINNVKNTDIIFVNYYL